MNPKKTTEQTPRTIRITKRAAATGAKGTRFYPVEGGHITVEIIDLKGRIRTHTTDNIR